MTFALYALLPDDAPPMTTDTLAAALRAHFAAEKDMTLEVTTSRLKPVPTVRLAWPGWGISVTFREDERVRDDSREIARLLGDQAPPGLANIDRRVYAVFGDDPTKARTNEAVFMMEFLESLPGAIVFDPQQNKLLS